MQFIHRSLFALQQTNWDEQLWKSAARSNKNCRSESIRQQSCNYQLPPVKAWVPVIDLDSSHFATELQFEVMAL